MTTSHTILVVEDKSGEREALARVLRLEDYQVLTAPNYDQANRYLREPVDLVISDLRMPGVDGIEAIRGRIRTALQHLDDVPAELGAHGIGDLADRRGVHGLLEFGHHLARVGPAQITPLDGRGLIIGVGTRQ